MSSKNPNPSPSQPNPEQEPEQSQQNQPKPPEASKAPEAPKAEKKEKESFFYGNTDKEKKHKLPLDYKDRVVVNQVRIRNVEGNVVELENSRQIQTYTVEFYERVMKMEPDYFAEAGIRVKVLHDPRIK